MTVTDSGIHLPDDWREWPPAAKMRLRWRLQTDWNEDNPRPNQLTPDRHRLCQQSEEACERAILEVRGLEPLTPEQRFEELAKRGHVDWLIWLILTGRGWGKTRVGAEDMAQYARANPMSRLALVAATLDDVRKTMVEGESGLLEVLHESEFRGGSVDKGWNRTTCELWLANGTKMQGFTAEKPNRLRGPQHHRAWADELAAWENLQETWDMLMFGLRLGELPQVIITTTPKPKKLLIDVRDRPTTIVTRGRMTDNAANLAAPALAELKRKYEGTRLGRQELDGELIEEVEGALWSRSIIDETRVVCDSARTGQRAIELLPELRRVVVAVDPATTATPDSDETGIILAGLSGTVCPVCQAKERHGLVLADRSCRERPSVWAKTALNLLSRFKGDRIVAESNQGGDMVANTIHTIRPNAAVELVHAKRGKLLRAQPVASLYEQRKVHHIGTFTDLEDQMCTWDPLESDDSPDRLDALVYALTDLMVGLRTVTHGKQQVRTEARR